MKSTFRQNADARLQSIRFTESMRQNVLATGRERARRGRIIRVALAACALVAVGIAASLLIRPFSIPDTVTTSGHDTMRTLTIMSHCGEYPNADAAAEAFALAHPDINLQISNEYTSEEPDIHIMHISDSEYTEAYSQGLMYPLSENEGISDAFSRIYLYVQQFITADGVAVAMPVSYELKTEYSYYPGAFARLGLSETDVPATWAEFLDFLEALPALLETTEGVSAFTTKYSYHELREMVLSDLIISYSHYMHATGQLARFDTPLFTHLLSQFMQIDFSALGNPETGDHQIYGYDEVLFSRGGMVLPNAIYYELKAAEAPMALSMAAGSEAILTGELIVAFIDPNSENIDLAMEYLELLLDFNQPGVIEALTPDFDAFDSSIVTGFEVTEESYAWYSAYAENAHVATADCEITELYYSDSELHNQLMLYLDNSIDADALIESINAIISTAQ